MTTNNYYIIKINKNKNYYYNYNLCIINEISKYI